MFPPHCVEGTPESEVCPSSRRFAYKRFTNNATAPFLNRPRKELQKLKPEKIIVCGVCTDICVMHTVADARNRDYAVEVPMDCVASFDNEAHEWALTHMEKVLGARLTHLKEMK